MGRQKVISPIVGRALFATALGVFAWTFNGCSPSEQWPAAFPNSVYRRAQLGQATEEHFAPKPDLQQQITEFLTAEFGVPAEPKIKSASAKRNRAIYLGSRVYRQQCMYCHGLSGNGEGTAAAAFEPRPRDYRRGVFKWKSTRTADRPTRDDLLRTIAHGVPGTSMPSFKMLPEENLRQLVEYVVYLSQRGEVEYRLLLATTTAPDAADDYKIFLEEFADIKGDSKDTVFKAWETMAKIEAPTETVFETPEDREAAILRGRGLFVGTVANCIKCHGVDGKGRPKSPENGVATIDKDFWGRPANPRDLTHGEFRGGRAPADLYRRIHQGIFASGMQAFENSLKPNEIWDLVHFVRALPYRTELLRAGSAPTVGTAAPLKAAVPRTDGTTPPSQRTAARKSRVGL